MHLLTPPRVHARTQQLLNQMDGFDSLGRTKLIMATNRPDTLDPALMRPGRLDRKIEVPLPNEQARLEILKIHAGPVNKHGDIDYEAIVKVRLFAPPPPYRPADVLYRKLSDGFNGADLRNVVTEAGMFAIRDDRCVPSLLSHRFFFSSFSLQGIHPAGGFDKSSEEGRRGEETRE